MWLVRMAVGTCACKDVAYESANGVILWNADVRPVKGLKAPTAVV